MSPYDHDKKKNIELHKLDIRYYIKNSNRQKFQLHARILNIITIIGDSLPTDDISIFSQIQIM